MHKELKTNNVLTNREYQYKIKIKQIKILELKNAIAKMKNSPERFNSRFHRQKKDGSIKIIQSVPS